MSSRLPCMFLVFHRLPRFCILEEGALALPQSHPSEPSFHGLGEPPLADFISTMLKKRTTTTQKKTGVQVKACVPITETRTQSCGQEPSRPAALWAGAKLTFNCRSNSSAVPVQHCGMYSLVNITHETFAGEN